MPQLKKDPATTDEIAGLPTIGITIGEVAGIGPEIVLKALSDQNIFSVCRPLVIGDLQFLRRAATELGVDIALTEYDADAARNTGKVPVFDLKNLPDEIAWGIETTETGKASGKYIEAAVELWREGTVDAISTAPISKKSLVLGGYHFPGHTEFLAELTDTEKFAMSFFAEKLRVVLLSTHVSLRDAIKLVTKDRLIELIQFTSDQFSRLLRKSPKIAVAGLNPHASEGGMFGTEEADEMEPAIKHCREELGIDVSGPYSPDTVFLRGFKGEFDAVVACYHDQATIAVKSLSFGSSVNVTLGLPLIRTSVDHGTANDIAGKGVAEESSMKAAIVLAADLIKMRRPERKEAKK